MNSQTAAVIAEVRACVGEDSTLERPELMIAFVETCLAGVPADALRVRSVAHLYDALRHHFALLCQPRKRGEYRVALEAIDDAHGDCDLALLTVAADMAFLVDTVSLAVRGTGAEIDWMMHPVVRVERDEAGELVDVGAAGTDEPAGNEESLIRIEFAAPAGLDGDALSERVESSLSDLACVVADWQPMRRRLQAVVSELDRAASGVDRDERTETQAFVSWLADDHFTLLGYRCRAIETDENGADIMVDVPDTGLGLLREDRPGIDPEGYVAPADVLDEYTQSSRLLVITKANQHSWIHHAETMDVVAIKRLDATGNVIGAHRFLGMFSGDAYRASPRDIPVLRHKISHVMARAALRPRSHAAKNLRYILETFPRDELFQTGENELYDTVMGVLNMRETEPLRLFLRRDRYRRFFAAIVYVPRERYTVALRSQIRSELERHLNGECQDVDAEFLRGAVVRLHYQIATGEATEPVDVRALEQALIAVTRGWPDRVAAAARQAGVSLPAYAHAFDAAYRERFDAATAVADAQVLAAMDDNSQPVLRAMAPEGDLLTVKLYGHGDDLPLSRVLPVFEHFGLSVLTQHPYRVARIGHSVQWIHEFEARHGHGEALSDSTCRDNLAEAFHQIMVGSAEDDGLNGLIIDAGFTPRQVVLVRAITRYLLQTELPFSPVYIGDRLAEHAALVRALIDLFEARFDPDRSRVISGEDEARATIEAELDEIASLDADRVLRAFYGVVIATLRTNYFQRDAAGAPKAHVSIKLDPSELVELPQPRPWVETFVYAPSVEGVHLRGGPVARGGLRWSDRREDFRTEVLGLMKAQMVKNAVIVPVGAKGGFVAKYGVADESREARQARGISAYKIFIRGLLDITDNRVGDGVVKPERVIAQDGDDPYLVVAADKGTATFSDIANSLSAEYGFWLDDAFASGGSAGYDHKVMGITARGAWEGVKRHFREMGRDIQSEPFSVVAIGDMGGDVFGNGMLASGQTRLIAAFNHLHIFIDPDPDIAAAYAERKRLFAGPASGWRDYDERLISRGGGVYDRSAKTIELSDEARVALAIEPRRMSPDDLINAILKAPVDLLWNGGIGTYVKASTQSHTEVGDRANDTLRVDGRELRARVVGEGGNLGLTQAGRIEYALNGGKLNTDAIDNSGGVDSSDMEVNIKIALGTVEAAGRIDREARNALLAEMTPSVIDLVLRTNYLQTQQISLMETESVARFDEQISFMRALERDGRLDRRLEGLPDDETIEARRRERAGLTRPELSVLISYNKLTLSAAAIAGGLADDPWMESWLTDGFPPRLVERFPEAVTEHRLKRELIATLVTNQMVDRLGIATAHRLPAGFGARMEAAVRGYVLAEGWLEGETLFNAIEALDNVIPAAEQYRAHRIVIGLLKHAMNWWITSTDTGYNISDLITRYQSGARHLLAGLADRLVGSYAQRWESTLADWQAIGVDDELARRIASADVGGGIMDIVSLAERRARAVAEVADIYYRLGDALSVPWLQEAIHQLPANGRWQDLARTSLRSDSYLIHQRLVDQVLATEGDDPLAEWCAAREHTMAFVSARLAELQAIEQPAQEHLTVAVRDLARLGQPGPSSLGGAA
ncbi:NAD-glutamate dehydrogenase [Salinisphaera sp. LB1]|uniref:NAD-glutamate dehydrogenase n=1 Tax=Salinisphaera sp. LB1 TaxID=2183911 RepID=UPI000D707B29|nr:NAD-glutamate dehydrogenase [Salinisphaera sp. LB1]AWN17775.1 NAD-specific glutamate dehydrogenase, large form [Salinisphaera sp. LB1]